MTDRRALEMFFIVAAWTAACGGGSTTSVMTPTAPTPPTPPPVSACFSFSPSRVDVSSAGQSVTVQVTAPSTCSWSLSEWPTWITFNRTGPLFNSGNGTLGFQVQENNASGCPTVSRTGRLAVIEEVSRRQGSFEVLQQGARGPFQAPSGCSITTLPYGITTSGGLAPNDCRVSGTPARYYTFQTFAEQRITLRMTAGRFVNGGLRVPLMRLYGPNGLFVSGAGANVVVDNPLIDRELTCAGTYFLEVRSIVDSTFNPTGIGNFTLRLD